MHGLSKAIQKRGLPRALLTDNGSAMATEEVTEGLLLAAAQKEGNRRGPWQSEIKGASQGGDIRFGNQELSESRTRAAIYYTASPGPFAALKGLVSPDRKTAQNSQTCQVGSDRLGYAETSWHFPRRRKTNQPQATPAGRRASTANNLWKCVWDRSPARRRVHSPEKTALGFISLDQSRCTPAQIGQVVYTQMCGDFSHAHTLSRAATIHIHIYRRWSASVARCPNQRSPIARFLRWSQSISTLEPLGQQSPAEGARLGGRAGWLYPRGFPT